ncbi:MAG: ABC transporter substrate-binding protein [Myxococcales bacterium]
MLFRRQALGILAGTVVSLAACRKQQTASKTVKVQLNWVPEPEFGGLYEARASGAFSNEGLDVELVGGGASSPVVQIVASGQADFGVAAGEEVAVARVRGVDLVAIYATYQTSPQGIMVHASRGLHRLEDLRGGTLALETGAPFGMFVQAKCALEGVTLVSNDGGVAKFLHDKGYAQQCYVTSEPIAAKKQGGDPQVFSAPSIGFDPYANVLVCRGALLKTRPDRVRAFVRAVTEGWKAYLASPDRANEVMAVQNRAMDRATFAEIAEVQRPLIESNDTKARGLGAMRLERWKTLVDQLVSIKAIPDREVLSPESCFHWPA